MKIGMGLGLAHARGVGFLPSEIAGLKLWLRADAITGLSDAQAVASWNDDSGGGYHATQGTAGLRPLYKTNILNGKPVVRFDGSNDQLVNAAFFDFGNEYTVFAVAMFANLAGSNQAILDVHDNVDTNTRFMLFHDAGASFFRSIGGSTITTIGADLTDGVFRLLTGRASLSDGTRFYVNGTSVANGAHSGTNTKTTSGFLLGGLLGVGYPLNGDIAEIAIFDSALSDANLAKLNVYFNRWGLY